MHGQGLNIGGGGEVGGGPGETLALESGLNGLEDNGMVDWDFKFFWECGVGSASAALPHLLPSAHVCAAFDDVA